MNINRRPAVRVDDRGVHAACCGPNTWTATQGSTTVFVNGKGAHRIGDQNRHCGGLGQLVEGSPNVIVDDSNGVGSSTTARRASGSERNAGPSQRSDSVVTVVGTRSDSSSPRFERTGGSDITGQPDEHQIEVQLVNARGEPQSGVRFELTLPDGEVKTGTSAADGYIRISGLQQTGEAMLVLPELDEQEPR